MYTAYYFVHFSAKYEYVLIIKWDPNKNDFFLHSKKVKKGPRIRLIGFPEQGGVYKVLVKYSMQKVLVKYSMQKVLVKYYMQKCTGWK